MQHAAARAAASALQQGLSSQGLSSQGLSSQQGPSSRGRSASALHPPLLISGNQWQSVAISGNHALHPPLLKAKPKFGQSFVGPTWVSSRDLTSSGRGGGWATRRCGLEWDVPRHGAVSLALSAGHLDVLIASDCESPLIALSRPSRRTNCL